jgi:hypothetical protein
LSDQQPLLFLADPQRFWELVTTDDQQKRLDGLGVSDDLVLCEIVRYGFYNRREMIGPLVKFYREWVMKMPEDRRFGFYGHIVGFVENTSVVSINSFLPFIAEDRSRMVVATAVIDYVSLGSLTDDDPMSRVKDIVGMIESGMLENEGAAFGALLNLGDERVCQLLAPLRDSLDLDAVNEAVKCSTGFIHAATADFYMDWLEGIEGHDQDGMFGIVASGLALLKKVSRIDQVWTGHRPFPMRGVTREQLAVMNPPISLADYVKHVAPRLYALERSEPPPRIMPHVLAEWGLKPLTDPSAAAPLDDRAKVSTAYPGGPEPIPGGRIADVRREWWDGEGQIFLIWGILNPNGPTLYALGSREFDGKQRTFFRWMHMLGGCTTYAAEAVEAITYQGIYEDAKSIDRHLVGEREHGLFHVIPSFVIANGGDETLARIARRLLSDGEAAGADWGRHMAYVRRFGSDFFGRAGAEIREFYDAEMAQVKTAGQETPEFLKMLELRYGHLPDFSNAVIPTWTHSPMTPELFEEWWRIIDATDYRRAALGTLKSMWKGASILMSDDMKATLVPWDSVLRFLVGYGLTLPD